MRSVLDLSIDGATPLSRCPTLGQTSKRCSCIRPGALPGQRGRLQRAVEALWSVGAQLKAIVTDLDEPHLPLSEPIRKEAHRHFMGQGLLVFVDEKAT